MDKKSLRKLISQEIKDFSAEELAEWSHQTCQLILANEMVLASETIVAFWPLSDEVDIRPALRELYRQGKTVLLPHVISDTEMEICKYEGDESLKKGIFGLLEPIKPIRNEGLIKNEDTAIHSSFFTLYPSSLILVPGRAFDLKGHRLGRGKGYYDRFLGECTDVHTIGVCYPFQIINEVPSDTHDILIKELLWRTLK